MVDVLPAGEGLAYQGELVGLEVALEDLVVTGGDGCWLGELFGAHFESTAELVGAHVDDDVTVATGEVAVADGEPKGRSPTGRRDPPGVEAVVGEKGARIRIREPELELASVGCPVWIPIGPDPEHSDMPGVGV
ncbi:MAG: hypothetical protein R3F65_03785 [bacterium]